MFDFDMLGQLVRRLKRSDLTVHTLVPCGRGVFYFAVFDGGVDLQLVFVGYGGARWRGLVTLHCFNMKK